MIIRLIFRKILSFLNTTYILGPCRLCGNGLGLNMVEQCFILKAHQGAFIGGYLPHPFFVLAMEHTFLLSLKSEVAAS